MKRVAARVVHGAGSTLPLWGHLILLLVFDKAQIWWATAGSAVIFVTWATILARREKLRRPNPGA